MSTSEIVKTGVAWAMLGFLVFCVPAFFIPDAWPWYVKTPVVAFLGFTMAMWLRRGFEFAIEDAMALREKKSTSRPHSCGGRLGPTGGTQTRTPEAT